MSSYIIAGGDKFDDVPVIDRTQDIPRGRAYIDIYYLPC